MAPLRNLAMLFPGALALAACSPAPPADAKPDERTVVAAPGAVRSGTGPIVVELYQSQGCSSCPPTNAAFNLVADRADLIPLSFAVTYWDQLGWKDRFAKPAFTQRQRDYAKTLRVGAGVYTPQVVINGTHGLVGNGKGELASALAKSRAITGGPALSLTPQTLSVGKGSGRGPVWLVRYDPTEQRVAITAGENGGRTLPHRNIVRELTLLGSWSGAAQQFAIPAAHTPGLRTVVLVHDAANGAIVAAQRLPAA
jgi:hypothetical protein